MQNEEPYELSGLLENPEVVYKKALEKWGIDFQLNMLVEKCAELIVARNQLKRRKVKLTPIVAKIAAVEIMLGQMRCIIDPKLIDTAKKKKLIRLAQRTGQHLPGE